VIGSGVLDEDNTIEQKFTGPQVGSPAGLGELLAFGEGDGVKILCQGDVGVEGIGLVEGKTIAGEGVVESSEFHLARCEFQIDNGSLGEDSDLGEANDERLQSGSEGFDLRLSLLGRTREGTGRKDREVGTGGTFGYQIPS
jgi:hypothetical protein